MSELCFEIGLLGFLSGYFKLFEVNGKIEQQGRSLNVVSENISPAEERSSFAGPRGGNWGRSGWNS